MALCYLNVGVFHCFSKVFIESLLMARFHREVSLKFKIGKIKSLEKQKQHIVPC